MSTIIKIFKNLGTIVVLSLSIVYVAIVDYMSLFSPHSPHKDTKNKTATSHTKTLRDVCWDSSLDTHPIDSDYEPPKERMVEWYERTYYE